MNLSNEMMEEIDMNYSMPYTFALRGIVTYLLPIIFLVGTIGNTLIITTMVVVHRRSHRGGAEKVRTRMEIYLILIAVADLAVLLARCPEKWLAIILCPTDSFDLCLRDRYDFFCKAGTFLDLVSSEFSIVMLCVLSLDRTFGLYKPFLANQIKTRSTKIACALMFLIVLAINGHTLVTKIVLQTQDVSMCIYSFSQDTKKAWIVVTYFLYCYLPMAIIIVTNTLIVFKVCKRSCKSRKLFENQHSEEIHRRLSCNSTTLLRQPSPSRDDTRLSLKLPTRELLGSTTSLNRIAPKQAPPVKKMLPVVTIIALSNLFIFTYAPAITIMLVMKSKASEADDPASLDTFQALYYVFNIWTLLNHSTRLFVYLASGPQFRKNIRSVFCKPKIKKRITANPNCGETKSFLQTEETTRITMAHQRSPCRFKVNYSIPINTSTSNNGLAAEGHSVTVNEAPKKQLFIKHRHKNLQP